MHKVNTYIQPLDQGLTEKVGNFTPTKDLFRGGGGGHHLKEKPFVGQYVSLHSAAYNTGLRLCRLQTHDCVLFAYSLGFHLQNSESPLT